MQGNIEPASPSDYEYDELRGEHLQARVQHRQQVWREEAVTRVGRVGGAFMAPSEFVRGETIDAITPSKWASALREEDTSSQRLMDSLYTSPLGRTGREGEEEKSNCSITHDLIVHNLSPVPQRSIESNRRQRCPSEVGSRSAAASLDTSHSMSSVECRHCRRTAQLRESLKKAELGYLEEIESLRLELDQAMKDREQALHSVQHLSHSAESLRQQTLLREREIHALRTEVVRTDDLLQRSSHELSLLRNGGLSEMVFFATIAIETVVAEEAASRREIDATEERWRTALELASLKEMLSACSMTAFSASSTLCMTAEAYTMLGLTSSIGVNSLPSTPSLLLHARSAGAGGALGNSSLSITRQTSISRHLSPRAASPSQSYRTSQLYAHMHVDPNEAVGTSAVDASATTPNSSPRQRVDCRAGLIKELIAAKKELEEKLQLATEALAIEQQRNIARAAVSPTEAQPASVDTVAILEAELAAERALTADMLEEIDNVILSELELREEAARERIVAEAASACGDILLRMLPHTASQESLSCCVTPQRCQGDGRESELAPLVTVSPALLSPGGVRKVVALPSIRVGPATDHVLGHPLATLSEDPLMHLSRTGAVSSLPNFSATDISVSSSAFSTPRGVQVGNAIAAAAVSAESAHGLTASPQLLEALEQIVKAQLLPLKLSVESLRATCVEGLSRNHEEHIEAAGGLRTVTAAVANPEQFFSPLLSKLELAQRDLLDAAESRHADNVACTERLATAQAQTRELLVSTRSVVKKVARVSTHNARVIDGKLTSVLQGVHALPTQQHLEDVHTPLTPYLPLHTNTPSPSPRHGEEGMTQCAGSDCGSHSSVRGGGSKLDSSSVPGATPEPVSPPLPASASLPEMLRQESSECLSVSPASTTIKQVRFTMPNFIDEEKKSEDSQQPRILDVSTSERASFSTTRYVSVPGEELFRPEGISFATLQSHEWDLMDSDDESISPVPEKRKLPLTPYDIEPE